MRISILVLALILCLGFVGCVPDKPKTTPDTATTEPALEGIPQETLDAIAKYIVDNSDGRFYSVVPVVKDNGTVEISVWSGTGMGAQEFFATRCELAVATVETTLADYDYELFKLVVISQSSLDSDKSISWVTTDLKIGVFVDNIKQAGFRAEDYSIEDIRTYFED